MKFLPGHAIILPIVITAIVVAVRIIVAALSSPYEHAAISIAMVFMVTYLFLYIPLCTCIVAAKGLNWNSVVLSVVAPIVVGFISMLIPDFDDDAGLLGRIETPVGLRLFFPALILNGVIADSLHVSSEN